MEYYDCDKCEGTGYVNISLPEYKCNKCNGTGKLNWLENLFGKSEPELKYYEPPNIPTEEIEKIKKELEKVIGLPRRYLYGDFGQPIHRYLFPEPEQNTNKEDKE